MGELVGKYGNEAQTAVLAFDEEHDVEFAVSEVVAVETDGRVLIRFQGYPKEFDMYVNITEQVPVPRIRRRAGDVSKERCARGRGQRYD